MIQRTNILKTLETNTMRLKRLGVRRIGVFETLPGNISPPDSEIGILVEFDRARKTFDNYVELKYLLENLLKRKVDLVTPRSLRPDMRDVILKVTQYAGL